MIKVLVIGPLPPPFHGVSTFTCDLLNAQLPSDIRLIHLDTSDPRDSSNIGRWDPTNIQLGLSNLAELVSRCTRSEIDLVYVPISQNVPAFLRDALYILQSRMLGCRVVIHLHGGYFRQLFDCSGEAFKTVARIALQSVSGAAVLGEEFRSIFSGLIPDNRIHVVENGVRDPGAWSLRFADRGKNSPPRILYMGTLTRTKGILELLLAVAHLRKQRSTVQLAVAGSWQEAALRDEAMTLIAREELQSSVSFLGNVSGEEKAKFLASGDVLCLLTRYPYEGQPLVILEALAAGLPVLSTDHAVIASTAPDRICGRIVAKDVSPQIVADVLSEMLNNREELLKYGNQARERYLKRYTSELCHNRLFDVFRNACR